MIDYESEGNSEIPETVIEDPEEAYKRAHNPFALDRPFFEAVSRDDLTRVDSSGVEVSSNYTGKLYKLDGILCERKGTCKLKDEKGRKKIYVKEIKQSGKTHKSLGARRGSFNF